MWADTETDVDFLNYSEVAELIAEMIGDDTLLPMSLGVFGGWGIGKSSTLNLVESLLKEQGDAHLIVRFDAWLYQGFDDARAALMSVIANALAAAAPEGMKTKAGSLIKRVNKMRVLGLLVEGGAAAMGFPTFGAAGRLVEASGKALGAGLDDKDREDAGEDAEKLAEKAGKLLDPAKAPTEEITAFRAEFGEILTGLEKKLVVFIDNLDRCLPANSIQTLEAIRLFLFLPNTAFVVAADEDMIRHAVSQHFHDPDDRLVTDYLDKLIQVPVYVPRPGILEIRAYLTMLNAVRSGCGEDKIAALRTFLIEDLRHSWKDGDGYDVDKVMGLLGSNDPTLRNQIELGLRMAPTLAQSAKVNGNPRIVKRMMNVVRMRSSVAKRRTMNLDEAIIAKLALFERCVDGKAIQALQREIQTAEAGRSELFAKAEAAQTEGALRGLLPEALKPHLSVLRDWFGLPPKLAGVDLRPAVYLSRETVPMRLRGSTLSPSTLGAVEALLTTATIGSSVAQETAAGIDPSEAVAAMEAMIAEIRKNTEWSKGRNDVRGSVILARAWPDAATRLNQYLTSLTDKPKWLKALIKNDTWIELA
ncbi:MULTISPECIES: P-loop NTPase fold protein [unclassified Novosphingobium]|uniref:KAP family P-loop NTPase fold protein n=1 Tax=unclassified Novosphingobium TaxID=2644732 RepID=UPI0013593847|nr:MULTISPECIES: P-loop NTPase fold protein [unclassified Novosphingobium]